MRSGKGIDACGDFFDIAVIESVDSIKACREHDIARIAGRLMLSSVPKSRQVVEDIMTSTIVASTQTDASPAPFLFIL